MKIIGDKIYIRFLEEKDAKSLLDLQQRNRAFFQLHSPTFEDIYTSEILVEFDYSGVDFSKVQKNEENKVKVTGEEMATK